MKYQKYDAEAFHVYTVKTDKFKTCHIEFIFQSPLTKENVTQKVLLSDLLGYTSKKYPTKKEMAIRLEELYSASFYSVPTRVGDAFFTTFVLNFLDPKYMEKGTLEECLDVAIDTIMHPNIKNGEFDHDSFEHMKKLMEADILNKKSNLSSYAIRQAIQNMGDDFLGATSLIGDEKALACLTPSKMAAAYEDFIEHSTCDIYIIGNLDMDYVVSYLKEHFLFRTITQLDLSYQTYAKEKTKLCKVSENEKTLQEQLVMLYTFNDADSVAERVSIFVMSSLFGQGSSGNKLMTHLREENSLCYTVKSMCQMQDHMMIVYAGIDAKNEKKAIELIKKSLKEMQQGKFTEEELEKNKTLLLAAAKASLDIPSSIVGNYLFHNLLGISLTEDRMDEIRKVTKEDVVKVAKKMKCNIIYTLKDQEGKHAGN